MKPVFIIGLFFAGMSLLLPAQAISQTIKIGTLAPDGSAWYESLREMGEEWENTTNGAVKIKIYPGGVAGDEVDMVRKMRIGQLNAATITDVGLSAIIREIAAFQMPLMFSSYEELDYVREGLASKLEELLAEQGFIVLNWGDAGWVRIFSQKPVVYPQDLIKQDQKIFVWAGGTENFNAWKAAGFHPVEVAATDIFMSLQTGIVNTFTTTPLVALSYQWFALAKNMCDLAYAPLCGATIITEKKWKQIPEDIRPILMQAARSSGEKLKKEIRNMDNEAVEVMKQHGLVVNPVPDAARKKWVEMSEKYLYPELLDRKVPRGMYDEMLSLLQEYRTQQSRGADDE